MTQDARDHGLRLGSYGDPMAVPFEVWQDLISALMPRSVVGYTHQWRSIPCGPITDLVDGMSARHMESAFWFRDNIMASCDSTRDVATADMLGWRKFLAVPEGTEIPAGMVQCPATREQNPLTCDRCGICNGVQGKSSRASVYLVEHGMRSQSKAKRVAALAVIP